MLQIVEEQDIMFLSYHREKAGYMDATTQQPVQAPMTDPMPQPQPVLQPDQVPQVNQIPQPARPVRQRKRRRPAWQRNLIKYWPPIRFGMLALILVLILVLVITLIFI